MTELISTVPNTHLALGVVIAALAMPMIMKLRRVLFCGVAIAVVIHLL